MKFDENDPKYIVSNKSMLMNSETQQLLFEHKERAREQLNALVNDAKNKFLGNDDSYIDEVLHPEKVKPKEKASFKGLLPLLIFGVGVISVLMIAKTRNFIGVMAAFFSIILAFGIYILVTGNAKVKTYSGSTSNTKGGGIFLIILGILGIIPALIGNRFALGSVPLLLGILLFGAIGIYMIVQFIMSLPFIPSRYKVTVDASCVGFARWVESMDSGARIYTSPIFVYEYEGSEYTSLYDNPIMGSEADTLMGNCQITIDPKFPNDIRRGRRSTDFQALLISLLLLLMAGVLVYFMFANNLILDECDNNTQSISSIISTLTNKNVSNDEKSDMLGSIFTGSGTITDKHIDKKCPNGKTWYVEEVYLDDEKIVVGEKEIILYVKDDDAFAPYTINANSSHRVAELYEKNFFFYTIDEEAKANGKPYKIVFFSRNAVGYTYEGDHKAYMG